MVRRWWVRSSTCSSLRLAMRRSPFLDSIITLVTATLLLTHAVNGATHTWCHGGVGHAEVACSEGQNANPLAASSTASAERLVSSNSKSGNEPSLTSVRSWLLRSSKTLGALAAETSPSSSLSVPLSKQPRSHCKLRFLPVTAGGESSGDSSLGRAGGCGVDRREAGRAG